MITARLKLIEVARPKNPCRCCEKMVQYPAPTRSILGSLAGPSLLAFILVAKYDDHLPLYEYICEIWTSEPDRFILDRIHQMPGLNNT